MSGSARALRVADQIQIELSDILRRRMKDPRLGFVTVTGVDVPADLRSARVFISALDEDALAEALELLQGARGFLRSELGRRLTLRSTPELFFRPDRSAERGRRIEDLLREIQEEPGGGAPDPDAPPEGSGEDKE